MKRFSNYHELYYHIVRSFYIGEYQLGDRFPTQVELATKYEIAANSVKKVFKLLLEQGFIVTDRSFGTHVAFDRNNPDHLAQLPLAAPNYNGQTPDTMTVPALLIAYTVSHAIQLATPEQLQNYLEMAQHSLRLVTAPDGPILPEGRIFERICYDLGNSYLTEFMLLLSDGYLCINQAASNDPAVRSQGRAAAQHFYAQFCEALTDCRYQRLCVLILHYYNTLYHIPALLRFFTPAVGDTALTHQPLYARSVHRLFLSIVSGNLRPGDLLPTEQQLAHDHGVSLITVRKAAGMLKEIGLIDGERFVGTRVLADWDSPEVQQRAAALLEQHHQQVASSIFAEYVLGRALCSHLGSGVPPNVIAQMKQLLEAQWEGYTSYGRTLFLSDVVLNPLVVWMNSPLMQRCYFHVHEDLTHFLAIRLLQTQPFPETTRVYHYAKRALAALERGDAKLFLSDIDTAVLLNWQQLRGAVENTPYRMVTHTTAEA
ncbi:MAG: GntR family transcriptional regulator [Angelakisella sp.]